MLRSTFMSSRPLLFLAATVALATVARAQITHLEALSIDGATEVPSNASPATGRGDWVLSTVNHTLHYNVSFMSLTSAEISAHIHQALPGVNGPIIFAYALGSPKTGVFTTTAGQEATLNAGGMYTNIHSNMFPGGEIRGQMVPSPAIGTPFCFGDGTSGPCPCANTGGAGRGCENSSTTGGAQLSASGHISPDNVVLIVTGEKPTALTLFVQGSGGIVAPTIFGDGLRCCGGPFKRLAAKGARAAQPPYPTAAEMSITARSAFLGDTIMPGTTRCYFAHYRDAVAGFCPNLTFNTSNSVDILW